MYIYYLHIYHFKINEKWLPKQTVIDDYHPAIVYKFTTPSFVQLYNCLVENIKRLFT